MPAEVVVGSINAVGVVWGPVQIGEAKARRY